MSKPHDALDVYLADMLRAVEAGSPHSALALALALPDICASIEDSNLQGGDRYRSWCEDWGKMIAVSAADCYAIRCAYLHSGQDEFSGPSAKHAPFERIEFTLGLVGGGWASTAIPAASSNSKPVARIPLETFCRDMATSADAWRRIRGSDPRIATGIAGLMSMRFAGP